ncbi:MAG: TIGR00725 family protein [Dehalococcoidia bacterium]|nr:TIGR00725 family protein [Dehalococcoidia bacterium]MQG16563.1 TIGR00725 family protein [SAR202 cluster bacterium]|tara:strand:+ start:72499 stop:72993 length:495 start_codon:yes stop_codon:yes gene_type:complete
MIIAVIGSAEANEELVKLATKVGYELARNGVMIVCGGLGGVMTAVCKGAKEAGGLTIGILPGNDPKSANEFVDIPICTGMSYARNVIVVKTGLSVIAVGGAYGTLSEIGHALGEDIPVIGLKTWDFTQENLDNKLFTNAQSPSEAVNLAMQAAVKRDKLNKSIK